MIVLWLLFRQLGIDFQIGQIAATLTAMTSNFALNNVLTYYDRRLVGWAWIRGWFSFALASSVGAIANVGIATYLFTAHHTIWFMSAIAGILVGVVWNYAVTSYFTWRKA
jgi:dolichol-phosphate mannosyltransferase